MKLLNLKIEGYKNLKNGDLCSFDFSKSSNYVALIGLNGSGKSNVLEAVSTIFYNIYYSEPSSFKYTVNYEIEGINVKIKDDEIFINNKRRKKDFRKYLPSEIISCYSGEELRMWEEIYAKPYLSYFKKIRSNVLKYPLRFVYINKNCWEIALIALLCHENDNQFIKELFKINDSSDVEININYVSDYARRKTLYENSTGVNELTNFIARLKNNTNPLAITQISTLELAESNNSKFCRKLFYFLFLATMPKNKKLIDKIEIKFGKKSLKNLSEGEKKLILVRCITNILAKKSSLVLFDEPDSSLHIHRKEELRRIIDVNDKCTLLTTHSPSLLNLFKDENIFVLSYKNETEGIEVSNSEKLRGLELISGGQFTLMDGVLALSSKKNILLVEGETDEIYFKRAFELLESDFPTLNYDVFETNSCTNLKQLMIGLAASTAIKDKFVIGVLDDDKDGKNVVNQNFKKVENENNIYELTSTIANNSKFYAIILPKTEGFNGKSFTIENLFSADKYKEAYLTAVNEKTEFFHNESISEISDDIEKKAKKRLSDISQDFSKDDFIGFEQVLRLIEKIQEIN